MDLFPTPTGGERSDIEVHLIRCGHLHLDSLVEAKIALLRADALLHLTGQHEGEKHDLVLENLDRVDNLIQRGRAAIWS